MPLLPTLGGPSLCLGFLILALPSLEGERHVETALMSLALQTADYRLIIIYPSFFFFFSGRSGPPAVKNDFTIAALGQAARQPGGFGMLCYGGRSENVAKPCRSHFEKYSLRATSMLLPSATRDMMHCAQAHKLLLSSRTQVERSHGVHTHTHYTTCNAGR